MSEFKKLNSEPIMIERVTDEHEEKNDFKPSFWWRNRRHYLEDFTRVHNNPWIGTTMCDMYPDYIHGMESENYFNPLFIELLGDGELNVYEACG